MVSFIGQAQIKPRNLLLDLAQLNQGIDSIGQAKRYQQQTERQDQQQAIDNSRQNRLLDLQEQKARAGPAQTAGMQEYQLAKQQGFGGSFLDYKTALKKASANNVTVNNAGETSYDKEIGKQLASEFKDSQIAGGKASQDLADLKTIQSSLDNPAVYTGTAGKTINSIKKAAGTLFGIDVEGVADAEVINVISSKMALALKDDLPGPMSNADREFLQGLPPGLTNSPEGARRLVQLGIAKQQWKQERALVARQYAAQNGGRLDPGFFEKVAETDAKWASAMGGMVEQLRSQPQEQRRSPLAGVPDGAVQKLLANPSLAVDFDAKYGQGASAQILRADQ